MKKTLIAMMMIFTVAQAQAGGKSTVTISPSAGGEIVVEVRGEKALELYDKMMVKEEYENAMGGAGGVIRTMGDAACRISKNGEAVCQLIVNRTK